MRLSGGLMPYKCWIKCNSGDARYPWRKMAQTVRGGCRRGRTGRAACYELHERIKDIVLIDRASWQRASPRTTCSTG